MPKRVTDKSIYIVSAMIAISWPVAALLLALLHVSIGIRILIALVPVSILVYQIILAYRYATGQDEVQKRIILEGLAIGFSTALPVIFLIGFLMEAGVKMPFKFMDAGYFLEVGLLIGYAIAWRRYTT
jgi:NADH:ubiquinone oxidoreductase subunit 3 (subunit A)